LSAYKAEVYIDCTGDGDLSAWAGAPFEKGDPQNGETQPVTHCFTLSNVDSYAYAYHGQVARETDDSHVAHILNSQRFPLIKDRHCCNNFVGPGTVGFNAGHLWDVDSADPTSVSEALIQGREIAEQYRQALAEFYPQAFANSFLSATGALLGVRESRRIIGDYMLSIEDWLERRSFHDEICRNNYPIDIHTAKDEIVADQQGQISPMDRFKRYRKGESHGIPYRCLTPQGKSNLLTAGRAISTDRVVQASTRVMPVCLSVGQAAGTAAALALHMETVDVHRVDTGSLRGKLRDAGVYLP
ncbi:MAG: FAD-dependent oxidoreductase, partial [Spirochaetota bacterium]